MDFCLVPEANFSLDGKNGLFNSLSQKLENQKYAVVVVAEGAGHDLLKQHKSISGIGKFLEEQLSNYFTSKGVEITLKSINPTYMIRTSLPTSNDSAYCLQLAQNAVHAGMAGYTDMVVASRHRNYVDLPMGLVTLERNKVDLSGDLWSSVLNSTGQPMNMKD